MIYIYPSLASGAGNPGWSRTRPKLVCCEAWWLRSNKQEAKTHLADCIIPIIPISNNIAKINTEKEYSLLMFLFSSAKVQRKNFRWKPEPYSCKLRLPARAHKV